jgi:hypothetical protein
VGRIVPIALLAAIAAGCSSASHVTKPEPRRSSSNPYIASLAYAKCLRARGVPHPNPDRHGDFDLTPANERRLRSVPKTRRDAAMKACFHNLAGLNHEPLSDRAHKRALRVLVQLKRCLHGFGYEVGRPVVRNMSFGRRCSASRPPARAARRGNSTRSSSASAASTWRGRSAGSSPTTGGRRTAASEL